MAVTVRDVLYFYRNARAAYERFIGINVKEGVARNAVALLIWLDQGDQQVMSYLPGMTPAALGHLAEEAASILDCLRQQNHELPPTPLISALCQDSLCPEYFTFNQDLIVRGVADILAGVGVLVFDDRLYLLMRRYQTGLVGHMPELDAPYTCNPVTVPQDCRSMFVTFSRGQPVERDDIFNYFRENWGDCIVRVLIEKTTGGTHPMYGRIVFKNEAFVSLVLNGEDRISLTINGREIWLRKYKPRPHVIA
ncbi:hypothetical protein BS78_05G156600 [Paspalum vaginatum]|nr:hypothetical protein BS78_05G156600 [Paspalum vaginatum]